MPNPGSIINPGSIEAINKGCTCPHYDNNKGHGLYKNAEGVVIFIINEDCPLHGSVKKGNDK